MLRLEMTREIKVFIITLIISFVLLFFAALSGDRGVIGNVIIISLILVLAPQLVFNYLGYKELKEIELRYPDFLRDLVEATRAGLPLHKAIIFVSSRNYGALSREVQKMAHQLSWNVDVGKVLEQSQKRLKRSKTLAKVIRIMIETYNSGGNVDDILESLTNTLTTIQETQKERESMLNQYVMAMYAVSIIFIGIIVIINRLLVPIFNNMATGFINPLGGSATNPCLGCSGLRPECIPCGIYSATCSVFGILNTSISCYYFALFFAMSVIQAVTGGLVAGQIGEGSVKAGIKHSLILLAITLGTFFILVKLGLMGV